MAYIEFQHVKKFYGKKNEAVIKALDDTNFTVEEGELAVILGASGAGKTTALNILGGMDQATQGEVIVAGKHLNKFSEKELVKYRRNDVGFVFQFYNLVPNLTALENVELAVQICKDYLNPEDVLKKVGLEDRMKNFPAQLSGGEQQRVALARALVNQPNILLADEPTGNLDPKNSKEIMKLLETINERGTTVVVVTHNQEIVDAMKKRVIAMHKGVIISDERKAGYTQHAD